MITLKECSLSIVSAALICSILQTFFQVSVTKNWMHLICGVFITAIILSNIGSIDIAEFLEPVQMERYNAEKYILEGKSRAEKTLQDIIKQNVQAYILDRAKQMDLSITVTVTLSDDDLPLPEEITIGGNISPYEKTLLSSILTDELGIDREDLLWIG